MEYDKMILGTPAGVATRKDQDLAGETESGSPPDSPGGSRGDRRMRKPAFPIHSYPWYVHDWRQSMMRLRLSPIGRYVYRELLDQCYIDGSIPNEPELLAKIVDLPRREFDKVWSDVSRAFDLREDGRYHHSKADTVLTEIERWKEQKSNAGKRSGESRRTTVERPLNDRSSPDQHPINGSGTAVEPSVTVTVPVAVPDSDSITNSFAKLYARHPKKHNRIPAEQQYISALSKVADGAALMARIDRSHAMWCASDDWKNNGGRYAPKLDRWLADHGWEDEAPQVASIVAEPDPPKSASTPEEIAAERQRQIDAFNAHALRHGRKTISTWEEYCG